MASTLPALKGIDTYFVANHLAFKTVFDSLEP